MRRVVCGMGRGVSLAPIEHKSVSEPTGTQALIDVCDKNLGSNSAVNRCQHNVAPNQVGR